MDSIPTVVERAAEVADRAELVAYAAHTDPEYRGDRGAPLARYLDAVDFRLALARRDG